MYSISGGIHGKSCAAFIEETVFPPGHVYGISVNYQLAVDVWITLWQTQSAPFFFMTVFMPVPYCSG